MSMIPDEAQPSIPEPGPEKEPTFDEPSGTPPTVEDPERQDEAF